MKIAQALNLRKALNDQLNKALKEASSGAYSQDRLTEETIGSSIDPNEKVKLFLSISDKLQSLIAQINYTNSVTKINYNGASITLTSARVMRDVYAETSKKLNELPIQAVRSSSTITMYNLLNVPVISASANSYARISRELDDLIQQTNWQIDLLGYEEGN